tara:strand:- start:211 stop:483 length:273 start_codon:yes stop_codon:yes gene_type:complete
MATGEIYLMRIMLLKCHSVDSVLESNKIAPNNAIVMLLKYNFIVIIVKYIRFGIDSRFMRTNQELGTEREQAITCKSENDPQWKMTHDGN